MYPVTSGAADDRLHTWEEEERAGDFGGNLPEKADDTDQLHLSCNQHVVDFITSCPIVRQYQSIKLGPRESHPLGEGGPRDQRL